MDQNFENSDFPARVGVGTRLRTNSRTRSEQIKAATNLARRQIQLRREMEKKQAIAYQNSLKSQEAHETHPVRERASSNHATEMKRSADRAFASSGSQSDAVAQAKAVAMQASNQAYQHVMSEVSNSMIAAPSKSSFLEPPSISLDEIDSADPESELDFEM